ncbi:MAG: methyltransferase domain-containing protein [Saprospiraceae bacterium]|nr:methyltransferase domain-containing protein [Saprospiraceae bacterium]
MLVVRAKADEKQLSFAGSWYFYSMFLHDRSHQIEQLDNFELSGTKLRRTLRELGLINRLFGNVRMVKRSIWREMKKANLNQATIVDLGCGGGDLLAALAQSAERKGYELQLIGIDGNPASLSFAEERYAKLKVIRFQEADIGQPEFQVPPCDFLISSHFLYHLPDQELPAFLQKQLKRVRQAAIFSELDRHFIALQLFKFVSLLLGFSKMTRQDGQTAVRRAFRRKELVDILQRTSFVHYRLAYKWAFRHLLTIYCSHDDLSQ